MKTDLSPAPSKTAPALTLTSAESLDLLNTLFSAVYLPNDKQE